MPSAPPPLPDRSLQRVLTIARVDGWSIVIVATLGALVSLVQSGWVSAGAALLVALAGAGELSGRRRLLRRESRGLAWLIGAQLFLLAVIWAYAWWRWRYFDPVSLWAELPGLARATLDQEMLAAGLDPELDRPLLLQMMNILTCLLLALVTLLYQGGLALYYFSRRNHVRQALIEHPSPPPARPM